MVSPLTDEEIEDDTVDDEVDGDEVESQISATNSTISSVLTVAK